MKKQLVVSVVHVEVIRLVLNGNFIQSIFHLGIVLAYTGVIFGIAVLVFRKRMNGY